MKKLANGGAAKKLLTRQEAADRLGVSLRALDELPVPRVRLTRRLIRYEAAALEAFIREQTESAEDAKARTDRAA